MKKIRPLSSRRVAQWIATVLLVALALKARAQTTVESFQSLQWDRSHAGTPLDLGKGKETFRDDFNVLSVTADGGKGPWYAPIHSDYGASHFLAPSPTGPYIVSNGKLTIRAEENGTKWTSGTMQTVDSKGHGFAQQYGYFEMSAQMPEGTGTWPGFWLLSQNGFLDKTKTRTEIDAVEWYGGDPKGVHTTVHLWPATHPDATAALLKKHVWRGKYYNASSILANKQLVGFHTYGIKVTPDWVIAYFDRKETERFPTLPEFKTPLYMLVSLAMHGKELAQATSPKDMVVDYVAAYSLDPAEAAGAASSPSPTTAANTASTQSVAK